MRDEGKAGECRAATGERAGQCRTEFPRLAGGCCVAESLIYEFITFIAGTEIFGFVAKWLLKVLFPMQMQ